MKEIVENTNRWEDTLCSRIRKFNIKMTMLLTVMYRFHGILIKCTKIIFHRTRTKTYKISVETQKTPNIQNSLEKKNEAGGITLPDFKPYHRATVIKTE